MVTPHIIIGIINISGAIKGTPSDRLLGVMRRSGCFRVEFWNPEHAGGSLTSRSPGARKFALSRRVGWQLPDRCRGTLESQDTQQAVKRVGRCKGLADTGGHIATRSECGLVFSNQY